MGTGIGWRCKSCGAGESFMCGGGMLWFNEPEVVEAAQNGSLGPAMNMLLEDGIPEGWSVFRENVYYQCPNCKAIIPGGMITIDDRSGGWIVYHSKPEECPRCGNDILCEDDSLILTEKDLFERCEEYARRSCPNCGSTDVELETIMWD